MTKGFPRFKPLKAMDTRVVARAPNAAPKS